MKTRKKLSLLLCLCLLGGLLAGCGQGAAPSQSTAEAAANVAPEGGASSLPESTAPVTPENTDENTITYWSYTDSAQNLVDAFEAANPGIKVNLQVFGGDEYKTKLLTTLQSGKNIPDIFDLDEGYAYEFFESDALEDLGARGFEDGMKDYYGYLQAGTKNTDGAVKAVCFQSSPVGFWYLRDACRQWLGTDDPDEIADMLSSWDKIKDVAQQVQEDSDGSVYLWPHIVEMVKVVGYSYQPLVRGGKFEVTDDWYGLLDTMRDFYDSGITANLDSWGEQWAAEWNEGTVLLRVMPSWDFFTDWDKNQGNVGIARPFENAFEGGTFVAMWSGSEKKDACDTFLQFIISEEFQTMNMEEYNQVPASSSVAKKLADGYTSERFGGQNLMETYDEINSGIEDITPDKYTRAVQNLFQKHAKEGIIAGLDNDQIIENLKAEVKDQFPELDGL